MADNYVFPYPYTRISLYQLLSQRPSPASFGVGQCQIGSKIYASDGSFWTTKNAESYFKNKLPFFNAAYVAMKKGVSPVNVALYGDSLTLGAFANGNNWAGCAALSYPAYLASLTGHNWQNSFGNSTGSIAGLAAYDPRWSFAPEWTTNALVSLGNATLDNSNDIVIPSAAVFTPTAPVDTVDVWYISAPGYGTFTISTPDNGVAQTVNCNAAIAVNKVTANFSTVDTAPISFTKTAAGQIHLIGISCYNSKAPSINLLRCGFGGATAGMLAAATNAWDTLNALKVVAPSLTLACLGVNDAIAGTPAATFQSYVQSIITAAKLSGDIALITPPPVDISVATLANQQSVRASLYTVANQNNVHVIDEYSEKISYAYEASQGFKAADKLHSTALGYLDTASIVIDSGIFY